MTWSHARQFRRAHLLLLGLGLLAVFYATCPALRAQTPRLVAYFPQWGIYNQPQYFVRDVARSGSAALLDQLDYAQGSPRDGRCSLADRNADLDYRFTARTSVDGHADSPASTFRGNFHQLEELKHRYPRLKVLISLEGSAAYFAADARPEARQAFVSSCIDVFLRGNFAAGVARPGLFDGIDLDWEYPKAEDAANYLALLAEFRRQMDAYRPGLLLTVAVGPSPHMYPDVDMAVLSKQVDEVGVMNYDYAGPWSRTTGMVAPLYQDAADPRDGGSVDGSLAQYRKSGVEPAKMLLGLPFYGYGWSHVGAANHGLYQSGEAIHGDQPYRYISRLARHSSIYRDPHTQAPWLFDGATFWSYDDPVSIATKVDYARQQGMGGVMVWELSGDSVNGNLLKAAHAAILRKEPCTAGPISSAANVR